MKATSSEKGRNVLLRADAGESLPEALVRILEDEAVACGWLRASGVLEEVELRAFRGDLGGLAPIRRLEGPVHVVALEGSIGLAGGALSVGLRGVFARETDSGLETLAGEIVSARVVALEVLVTALDDVAVARALDVEAGVWLLGEASGGGERARPAPAAKAAPNDPAWSEAVTASADVGALAPAAPPPRRPAPTAAPIGSAAMPARPARPDRPDRVDDEVVAPDVGAVVDHFAFGRCDVLKSDGDRLHLKVQKDGRVKEIALEMLRVTPLPDEDGKPRFKLERRL